VPVYDIRAAAGAGSAAEDGEPATYQVFENNFLSGLTRAPVRQLSVIQVTGDSMEPTIYGGDLVLVDHSVKSIDHGGLFILRFDDANIIKRCEKDYASKAVQIISDNSRYPVQTVKPSDRIEVIGRVIYIGRALR
jgi:phage repressor protein C with HTH and peptisase S24 domain